MKGFGLTQLAAYKLLLMNHEVRKYLGRTKGWQLEKSIFVFLSQFMSLNDVRCCRDYITKFEH